MPPFEHITRTTNTPRTTNRTPLFQILLTHNTTDSETGELASSLPGLVESALPTGTNTGLGAAKTDLDLDIVDTPNGMTGYLTYATELFTPTTIDRFTTTFERVLKTLTTAPDTRLADIPVLTDSDQEQLAHWSTGPTQPPADTTLDTLIRTQTLHTPNATAVTDDTQTQWSYTTIDTRANALAHILIEHGVQVGDRVAVILPRSVDLVTALLAVIRAGAAYVPIDPDYPTERITHILEDSTPTLLITTDSGVNIESGTGIDGVLLDDPAIAARVTQGESTAPVLTRALTPADTAYVIFTSGTTGRPKGVMISHHAIINLITWRQTVFPLTEGDRVLQKTSIGFDVSVPEIFWPLTIGATIRLTRPGGDKDPHYLTDILHTEPIAFVELVPTMAHAMLDTGLDLNHTPLRHLALGGETFPTTLATTLTTTATDVHIWNTYGPTEAAVETTGHHLNPTHTDTDTYGTDTYGTSVPIGTPITNTTTHVLDPWLREVPTGITGELYLGGTQLADGYIARPDLTATRFIANPHTSTSTSTGTGTGERLYRTGDLVRWNTHGHLEYLGRTDDQVKIRGYRIELDDIRTVLEQHPAVSRAVVIATDHPGNTHGGTGKYLAAYHTGDDVTDAELRTYMTTRLPDYMVPTVFIPITDIPTTPRQTRPPHPPPPDLTTTLTGGQPPTTHTEHTLATIFTDTLGLPTDTPISVDDDFFRLGGDSISSILVVSKARREGLQFTVRDVFEKRTIAGLAEGLDIPETAAEPIPLRASTTLERLREAGDEPNDWVYTELVAIDGSALSGLQSTFVTLVNTTDALRIKVSPLNRRLWTSEIAPTGTLDLSKQVLELDPDTSASAAANRVASLISITEGLPVAIATWSTQTHNWLLVAAHAAAADRSSIHEIARSLTGRVESSSPVSLHTALEAIDTDGQNLDAELAHRWVDATGVSRLDDSTMWSEGSHAGIRADLTIGASDLPELIAGALRQVAQRNSTEATIDLETGMASPRPAIGPFTATWPYIGGVSESERREYSLLRYHNRTGRRSLRKSSGSAALVTHNAGQLAVPGSREGVETAYRCVIRYRVADGAAELDIIGLSEGAVAALEIELSVQLDAAIDRKRS
ncbi:non-ribosomal peptide synthetase [Rhodococcus sp. P1Y]|uniref:non-ribosomal peptide synthetase n=1 Tax=Rhodococcus sp. P1Y TaxID=1302308 RepID=UPI003FA7A3B1